MPQEFLMYTHTHMCVYMLGQLSPGPFLFFVYACKHACLLRMAAEDKDLTEPAARNLSPGQLQSLFKMEPKTLGVSQELMSQQLGARLLPIFTQSTSSPSSGEGRQSEMMQRSKRDFSRSSSLRYRIQMYSHSIYIRIPK